MSENLTHYSEAQIELIKKQIMPGATHLELEHFISVCKHTGLDPFAGQIYAIKRKQKDANGHYVEKWQPQTSIDGFRAVAESTGAYAGSDEPFYEIDPKNPNQPIKATITIWKMVQGQRCSFTASARWSEYCPQEGRDLMWKKMPFTMLAKCCEALAIRKAFSSKLTRIYTSDEMAQADSPAATTPIKVAMIEKPAKVIEAQQVETSEEEFRGKIIDLLMEICGPDSKKIQDTLYKVSFFKSKNGKEYFVKDVNEISFDVKEGKKQSQAQVIYRNLKQLAEDLGRGPLDVDQRTDGDLPL